MSVYPVSFVIVNNGGSLLEDHDPPNVTCLDPKCERCYEVWGINDRVAWLDDRGHTDLPPYACETCQGTGDIVIAECAEGETVNSETGEKPEYLVMCDVCEGRGVIPIPWCEVMEGKSDA